MARPLKRDHTHVMEEECLRAFERMLPSEWIFRRQQPDYGIDAVIEIVEEENVTNKVLWVQLKSVEKAKVAQGKIRYSIETKYVQHFIACRLPVALVLCTLPDTQFFCLFAQKYLKEELNIKHPNWTKQKTVTIEFPVDSKLQNSEPLKKIATEGYFYIILQQLSLKAQGTTTYWLGGIPMSDDEELKARTLKALECMRLGSYKEAIEQFEDILRACTISPTERMSILLNLGNAYSSIGQYQIALKNYEASLGLSPKAEIDKALPGKSGALNNTGLIHEYQGNLDEALKFFQAALEIDEKIRHRQGETSELFNIGTVYRLKGELDKALTYHQAALKIDREIGYRQGEADSLGCIGLVYHLKGDLGEALKLFQAALKIHREVGDKRGEASDLGNIGLVYKDRTELDEALKYLQAATKIHREIGDRQGEASDLRNISTVYRTKGDLDEAFKYLQAAAVINIRVIVDKESQ